MAIARSFSRLLLAMALVLVVVIVIILIFLISKNGLNRFKLQKSATSNKDLVAAEQLANKLQVWNNFIDIQVIDECLLTEFGSCFPKAIYRTAPAGDAIAVSATTGSQLDVNTVRGLLMSDRDFGEAFSTVLSSNQNGLLVDDFINSATVSGINPLLLFEIVKSEIRSTSLNSTKFDPSIANLQRNVYLINVLPISIASVSGLLRGYYSNFSSGSPITAQNNTLMGLSKFGPMQKSVIFYFFTNSSLVEYQNFVDDFKTYIPSVGINNIQYKTHAEMTQLKSSQNLEGGYLFCDRYKAVEIQCLFQNGNLFCGKNPPAKVCNSYYYMDGVGNSTISQ